VIAAGFAPPESVGTIPLNPEERCDVFRWRLEPLSDRQAQESFLGRGVCRVPATALTFVALA
jgi:hypothetical protein